MPIYNVHISREVQLAFEGIEADSAEEAAEIACNKHPAAANDIDGCDGETFSAQVDDDSGQSVTMDFKPQRQRQATSQLLQIVQSVAELRRKWRSQDESETIDSIEYMDGIDALEVDTAIAKATAA